jgi:hypothetical protein
MNITKHKKQKIQKNTENTWKNLENTEKKTRKYCDVYATNKTGSSSDDWIYYQAVTHSLVNYTYTQAVQFYLSFTHQLKSTVALALGFSVSTSRLPATDVDAQLYQSHTPNIPRKSSLHRSSLLNSRR